MTLTGKLLSFISGTRRAILECLLKRDANAITLAEQLGINISAIRGHLNVLEIAGLISSRQEQAKRGRPKRIYFLTPLAHKLFPKRTEHLFVVTLQELTKSFDVKTTNSLIRQLAINIWQKILPEKPRGNLEEQLTTIVEALDKFGFYATLEAVDNKFTIVIQNDVFQPALKNIPTRQARLFQQVFWKHLNRIIIEIQIQISEIPDPRDHGYQIRIEERRE